MEASVFSSTEKVLLYYHNFLVENKNKKEGKKYLIKNKVKKDKLLYNICASIIANGENGTYEILIEKEYYFSRFSIILI